MPFDRPTPVQIRDRIAADVNASLRGVDARVRRSAESVLVRMTAIASHELHGHLAYVADAIMVDRAPEAELARHAAIWGVPRIQPRQAAGMVRFAGVAGKTVPAGTELRRADDTRYTIDADVMITLAGTASVSVRAVAAGAGGNAPLGTALNVTSPIDSIQPAATVIDDGAGAGLTGGTDIEDPESWRARILRRIQQPPAGGAAHDYVSWVWDVTGETRVWVYPGQLGRGTVVVVFISPDGAMPASATVDAVAAHIETVRPVTADVTTLGGVETPIAHAVRLTPDTAAVRAAVTAALAAFYVRAAEPGGTIALSRISEAISGAAGEFSHELLSPSAPVATAFGHLARLGAIDWGA